MDKLKKSQRVLRTTLTKQVTTLNECLTETELERERIAVVFQLLEDKMAELDSIQCKIFDTFMNGLTTSDEDIQKKITAADDYRAKYIQMKFKVRGFLEPPKSNVPVAAAVDPQNSQLSHRLPKLEIPKFSGNTRDWLKFWSQFKKVHKDDRITIEDKFRYLLQAVVSGSHAYVLVHSFPPTGDNYAKAVESLEEHFGRNDLLIEVYVRELLEVVLKNVMKKSENIGSL